MKTALMRRYKKLKQNELSANHQQDKIYPDILLIDGGKGQVKQAVDVLEELEINSILVIGITKGEGRKADLDTLFVTRINNNSSSQHYCL